MKPLKSLIKWLFADEVASYQKQLHSLCAKSHEKTTAIVQLTQERDELSSIILSLNKTIRDLHSYQTELENKLGQEEKHINSLQAQLSASVEESESQRKENQILTGKVTALNAEIVNYSHIIGDQTEEISSLKTICEDTEFIRRNLQQTTDSLKNELSGLTLILSDRETKISTQSSIIKILKEAKQSLEEDKASLISQLNQVNVETPDEELLEALKNDVKQKQEVISVLELDIQHLNEEISSIRNKKGESDNLLSERILECEHLQKELRSISAQLEAVQSTKRELREANRRIVELQDTLKNAPSPNELIRRDKELEELRSEIQEYKRRIAELEGNAPDVPEPGPVPDGPIIRKPKFPYPKKPVAPPKDVVTVDFPVIENDNVYSQTARLIDKVFDHRSNSYIMANDIFLHKPVEELSRMRFDLEEATRTRVPYLTCPCCGNMVKISSRRVGWGSKSKEVQFFTHAEKNVVCDLKRDNSSILTIENGDTGENDFSYLKELRSLLANSLRTELSVNMGISNVEDGVYIHSDELPMIMKRRLADVTARYNDIDLVFELVTPTTHIARVHDRDIFYLINRRQVFWVFGLESIVDYNELRRSVSKDIFFTNKRNVFVFDLEAQEESKRRRELMLKCNWLDEDGAWHYQIEKNGKNGILISLDQIHFEEDGCRPYFYDADEPFYLKHPTAERPLKLTREKLKQDIIEAWNYEQQRKLAIEKMLREDRSVEAYSDKGKWGFKFEETVFFEAIFDSKPIMLGDFAKVEREGKFGVVNKFGEYRLQPEYEKVEILPNGYILYASNDNWYLFGVIDPVTSFATNDVVSVCTISKSSSIYHLTIKKYIYTGQRPEELYFVANEIFKKNSGSGKWSLWQSNGEKATDVSWDSLEFTSEDTIRVSSKGRTQLLALDGTVIEEQKYKTETKLQNGYVIIETFDGGWGLIDDSGIEIVAPQYEAIIPITDKFLKYQKNNHLGIITTAGETISNPIYHSVEGFDGENFRVTKFNEIKGWGHLCGKIDKTGKPVSEVISQTENGCVITKSFEKYGLEKDGTVIIPHIYDELSYWGENKYIAQKDNKFGIIDTWDKVLLGFEFSSITPLKEGRSAITKGSSQQQIDSNLQIIEDIVINLQEGYKKIMLGGKWGVLNPKGEVIVDYLYDEISTFRGRLVGIINGRLVKLNAYYPYKLAMEGIIVSKTKNKKGNVSLKIRVRDVELQLTDSSIEATQAMNFTTGQSISVMLVNWTTGMKYPMVMSSNGHNFSKKSKHIDKPEDFTIGEPYMATIVSIINGRRKNGPFIKGYNLSMNDGRLSHIYEKDIKKSGYEVTNITIGQNIHLTKLGFDEELDRTIWRLEREPR